MANFVFDYFARGQATIATNKLTSLKAMPSSQAEGIADCNLHQNRTRHKMAVMINHIYISGGHICGMFAGFMLFCLLLFGLVELLCLLDKV